MKPAQGEPIASAIGARCTSPHRAPNPFVRLFRFMRLSRDERAALEAARARTERAKALAELQAAIRAKDTRRKHHAEQAAREATNRALGAGA